MENSKGTATENASWLGEKLATIRSVGTGGANLDEHLRTYYEGPAFETVQQAYGLYPSDWVKNSMDHGSIELGEWSRGQYTRATEGHNATLMLSGKTDDKRLTAAIHELAHRFEDSVPGLQEAEREFYDKRTAGEREEWLGEGYKEHEKGKKDDFLSAYMGKRNGDGSYELASMGFEYAYTDPIKLAADKDMESWTYGLLCLL